MRRILLASSTLAVFLLAATACVSANLIIFSRAIPPGSTGQIPVAVTAVGEGRGLVGIDMILRFPQGLDTPNPDSFFTLFHPTDQDVTITGINVARGVSMRTLYVAAVGGVIPFDTSADTKGTPATAIGAIELRVDRLSEYGDIADIGPVDKWPLDNYGAGSPIYYRPGASGAAIDQVGMITEEPITTPDYLSQIALVPLRYSVPLHMIAAGRPGDLNADGRVDSHDVAILQTALVTSSGHPLTAYQRIVADLNGDGIVTADDLLALRQIVPGGAPAHGAVAVSVNPL